MDSMKAMLEERKRKMADTQQGQNKYRRKGDIEKEQEDALLREKKRKEEELKKKKEAEKPAQPVPEKKEEKQQEKKAERKNKRPREEVIKRLRAKGHPITLFGESDDDRETRLELVEAQALEVEQEKISQGQRNDFAEELSKLEEEDTLQEDEKKKKAFEDEDEIEFNMTTEPTKHELEDFVQYWLRRWMREWEQDLDERPDSVRRTTQGRSEMATFQQTKKYLKPLYKYLSQKGLPDDVLTHLHQIICCLKDREYMKATEHYMCLSIGNAPWPMGVTMVGIHERSAREKIFSNQVAHIMNDETQRKYIQSVKRLMTFLNKKYPTVPSKSMYG